MKKSLVITILIVAGVSTALAHTLYHSINKSSTPNSNQYVIASCQDYQASVRIGGVVKITRGKACQLADGSWKVYPTGNRSMSVSSYQNFSDKYGRDCMRGKSHSKGMTSRKYQKWLHGIHGWNYHGKQQKRFQHPQIKPGQKYHKQLKIQQPLLVQDSSLFH